MKNFENKQITDENKSATTSKKKQKPVMHNIKAKSIRDAQEIVEKAQEFSALVDKLMTLGLKDKAIEIGSQVQDLLEGTNIGLGKCIATLKRKIGHIEKEENDKENKGICGSSGSYLDQAVKPREDVYNSTSSIRKKLFPEATSKSNQLEIPEIPVALNNIPSFLDTYAARERSNQNLLRKLPAGEFFTSFSVPKDEYKEINDELESEELRKVMALSEQTYAEEEEKRKKEKAAANQEEGQLEKEFSGEYTRNE